MSKETNAILQRLSAERPTPIVRRLRALLASPAARLTVASSHPIPASEIEPTWQVRHKIAKAKHKRLFGLPGVLEELRGSKGHIRILAAADERESATLFFDADTDRFLGAVVVVMSEHTRAFYEGRLTGQPFAEGAEVAKSA